MNCKTCSILLSLGMVSVMVAMISGCGSDGGAVVTRRPSITQTSPTDEAVDTNLNPRVQVWFNEALDPGTVDSASFHIEGAESHRVEYVDRLMLINLYLEEILEPDSTYTVVVTTDLENTKGHGMLSDFSFSFTTGILDADHLIDYMEPNNDMDSAVELDLNKTYTVLSSCGGGGEEAVDLFKFTLTEAAKITLLVEHSYSELEKTDWFVRLRMCGGAFYRSLFTHLDEDEELSLRHSLLPGTYCVETGNTEAAIALTVYDLTLQTSTPCPDDEFEDNDFYWEASEIVAGSYDLYGCNYDTDYFRVTLTSGQILTATINKVPAGSLKRRLRISNAANLTLKEASGTHDFMTLTYTADLAGDYHIVVDWWEDSAYRLSVDITD
jgi:hypothetical protein